MLPVHIGDYRLIARLGRGGMADVFLAVRRTLVGFTKLVVIKRLREDVGSSTPDRSYDILLLDEARLAARLHHPNIVQTFEVATDGDLPFIAMEYLDGQSLDRVLAVASRTEAGFPLPLALLVVSDLLAALEYAHDLSDYDGAPLGIVHRDVSPHNIFLTYQGEVKLVDFGVAKHAFTTNQTELGVVKGKLTYMAPEQAQRESVDRRADLFAAGVIMWECLAMRRLLAADSPAATLNKLLHEPLPSLLSVRPDLDPALSAICARALQRDPAQRYASARDMRAELDAAIGQGGASRAALTRFVQQLFVNERAARADQLKQAMAGDVIVNMTATPPSASVSSSVEIDPTSGERRRSTRARASQPTVLAFQGVAREQPLRAAPRSKRLAGASLILLATAATLALLVWTRWPILQWDRAASARWAAPEPRPSSIASSERPTPPRVAETVLRLCGSNTIGAELAPALIEAFLQQKGGSVVTRQRGVEAELTTIAASLGDKRLGIEIEARGSATAFAGLAAGGCDVGMASRPIEDAELATLVAGGHGDLRSPGSEHVIALDGIAVVVHPSNPLRALDRAVLHDIYTGKLTDWSQVGGVAGPIEVLARDSNSGTYDTFKHLVLGKEPLAGGAQRYTQSDALADAVASNPAAIGFVGLAYVRAAKALAVGEPGATPMLPTQFTVATEGYMLSRRLYLYTLPRPRTPWVTELVSFALSPRAQEVAAKSQFVDLTLLMQSAQCDTQCSERYASTVAKAQRLSVDFRFRSGSNAPD
ncbi:MAG: substrate-binding domain-containing protein, partial [Polyangiales bacterium]